MRPLFFLITLIGLRASGSDPIATGSYVGRTLDSHALPAELTASTTPGYYRWIKLDQALLRLQPNGRFTVSYRYYEQQLPVGKRPNGAKLMSETQLGSYTVKGNVIRFVPSKPKTGQRAPNSAGQITSKGIVLPYNLRDGKVVKRHALLVVRDPSYW